MTDAILLPGFEERRAELRGIRLRAYAGGPEGAEPIVLVHGLGGSAVNWTLLAPELARTRRGAGRDPARPRRLRPASRGAQPGALRRPARRPGRARGARRRGLRRPLLRR